MSGLTGYKATETEPMAFGVGGAVDDRRASTRVPRAVPITLTSFGNMTQLACTAEDLSECGLFLRVPVDYGLRVGQRCEVNFADDPKADIPPTLVGETCYATVVRTEQLLQANKPMLGAGLRFDQPIYL